MSTAYESVRRTRSAGMGRFIYRYRFAFDTQVVRTGQCLSDLLDPAAGDRRRRLRVGLVGLTSGERTAVAAVLHAA